MTISGKVTAAIPTLGRPDALARCLDALLGGEVLPAEVIVVDQGKDDAALRVVESRRSGPVPIVYVRQPRHGVSASRNAAIAAARYPIFAMTDDDCVPDSLWIATAERVLSAPRAPAAVTGRILPLGPEMPGLYSVSSRTGSEALQFTGKTLPWRAGSGGNFAITRDCLDEVGPYDERLGSGSPGKASEDIDFSYRLLRRGLTICYDPALTVYHQRQTLDRRISSRWTYGYGVGAFCGKWLRGRDSYALAVLREWLSWRFRNLVTAIRHRQGQLARESWLMLAGTLSGLAYGLRLRGEY